MAVANPATGIAAYLTSALGGVTSGTIKEGLRVFRPSLPKEEEPNMPERCDRVIRVNDGGQGREFAAMTGSHEPEPASVAPRPVTGVQQEQPRGAVAEPGADGARPSLGHGAVEVRAALARLPGLVALDHDHVLIHAERGHCPASIWSITPSRRSRASTAP